MEGEWLCYGHGHFNGGSKVFFVVFYKDLFIGPQEFVVGYSKAPKQPQSSARPICHSHSMKMMGTNQQPYALLHRSSLRYALRHGR